MELRSVGTSSGCAPSQRPVTVWRVLQCCCPLCFELCTYNSVPPRYPATLQSNWILWDPSSDALLNLARLGPANAEASRQLRVL